MDIVFRVKRFFNANLALVLLSVTLFLGLIISLSLQVRQREMETLFKIGCRRSTVVRVQLVELGVVLGSGALLAALMAVILYLYVIKGALLF